MKFSKVFLIILLFALFQTIDTVKAASNGEIYTGAISADLLMANYPAFNHPEQLMSLKQSAVEALAKLEQTYQIKVFFGLWCHDSEREIPRLLAALEAVKNNNLQLSMVAVGLNKRDPDGLAQQYAVRLTPTIVIEHNGKEIGRIVERPEKSIEENILAIINKSLINE